ncbi:TPA: RHS repeat-associated core domain-containing protein [Salmonella enterica]|nr:RHS repeat protein [Salmonella enterica subsp. enterica]
MTTTVFTGTPVISVTDSRGQIVRTLNWNRSIDGGATTLLVTHARAVDDTRTSNFRDPRLFAAWQTDDTTGANLTTFSSLAGQPLRRDSTDSGQNITVFDAEGRPAWSRDPAGTVMTWAYDELGRPVSTLQRLSTETVTAALFVYGDSDSQTASPQDNNLCGVCVRRYDEGGLLTTGSVALSGAALSTSLTFLLDAERLPDWPDDEAGRNALLESTTYTTTGQADALARTTARTDASGHAVSMTYDVSGVPVTQSLQLKEQSTDTPLLTDLTLNAAGQVLSETAGNGVTTTYSYEEGTLRLIGIAAARTGDSTALQSLGYTYDPVGNVTTVSDATVSRGWFRNQATDGSRSFTYDALYRLLSATGRENVENGAQSSGLPVMQSLNDSQTVNYTRSYSYDNSGNLTTLTHTGAVSNTMTMVTDTLSNRSVRQNNDGSLAPGMDWSLWFTPGGQLKTLQTEGGKPATGYTDSADPLMWDRNTRLQAVTLVSRSRTDTTQNDREVYQYRGGMRVRKQTRTLMNATSGLWTVNEVRYLPGLEVRNSWQETVTGNSATAPDYQEQLEVVTTQAGRSQIRVLHWVTSPPSGVSNDQIRYGVDDNIGSMQLELDSTGQLISREEYYPYGGTAVWAGRSQIEADYKTVRYSGQERDGAGLYYYGYRYYAPWLCRWTASDPAREIDGLNLFRMVENSPVTFADPKGLSPFNKIEKKIIESHSFSGYESQIIKKMQKPQKNKRQREIASQVEFQSAEILRDKNGVELKIINDYTTDSTSINEKIRSGEGFSKEGELDHAINSLSEEREKVTYRVATYVEGFSPWRGHGSINVGDIVMDDTYVSTSAHRGFLSFRSSKENKNTTYARIAVLSMSAVNVSGLSKYNNDTESLVFPIDLRKPGLSLLDKLKMRVKGPAAGQAEYLVPRGVLFKVMAIDHHGKNDFILLEEFKGISFSTIKNMYSGNEVKYRTYESHA